MVDSFPSVERTTMPFTATPTTSTVSFFAIDFTAYETRLVARGHRSAGRLFSVRLFSSAKRDV
jgi:hypothetical protein